MKTDTTSVCCTMKFPSPSAAYLPPPFPSSSIWICCHCPATNHPQQLPAHSATVDLYRPLRTAAWSPPTSCLAPASPTWLHAFSSFHQCTRMKLATAYWTVWHMKKNLLAISDLCSTWVIQGGLPVSRCDVVSRPVLEIMLLRHCGRS
jgi:hypothetical protein